MATAIALDSSDRATVTGTALQRLPHHAGRLRPELQRPRMDAFVARLNAAGSSLAYATFLGGD